MRVLVMESDRGAANQAADELRAAGHSVVRCYDGDEPPFPCRALEAEGTCPLEDPEPVDVALLVRRHPWPRPTPREHGVTCATRVQIPVVVAGQVGINPYEPWATEVVPAEHAMSGACERAAETPLKQHGEVATAALRETLTGARTGGSLGDAHVIVERRAGRLLATIHTGERLERSTADMAATRVLAALSAYSPAVRGIDVSLDEAVVPDP